MDPIVLATANVLVHAMSTDAWPQVRAAMVTLWRRARPEQADAVEVELEEAREVLLADRPSGDEAVKAGLVADWQGRVLRLLVEDPSLADELRRILNDAAALLPDEQARTNTITLHHGRRHSEHNPGSPRTSACSCAASTATCPPSATVSKSRPCARSSCRTTASTRRAARSGGRRRTPAADLSVVRHSGHGYA